MTTVRIWFTKTGEASYISLLDLQRVMQRTLKRTRLPVWYTLGFNPHIYMTFAAPLALGQESMVESFDVKTEQEDFDWAGAKMLLNSCLPRGIVVQRIVPAQMDAGTIGFAQYEIRYAPEHAEAARAAFDAYDAMATAPVEKKGKRGSVKTLDLKEHVEILSAEQSADGFTVTLRVPAGSVMNVNPSLLLQLLEQQQALPAAWGNLMRTEILTKSKEKFV